MELLLEERTLELVDGRDVVVVERTLVLVDGRDVVLVERTLVLVDGRTAVEDVRAGVAVVVRVVLAELLRTGVRVVLRVVVAELRTVLVFAVFARVAVDALAAREVAVRDIDERFCTLELPYVLLRVAVVCPLPLRTDVALTRVEALTDPTLTALVWRMDAAR